MATTYHGLTKIECRVCGDVATSRGTMESWNDYGAHCLHGNHQEMDVVFTSINGDVRRLSAPDYTDHDSEQWETLHEADFDWNNRDMVAKLLPNFVDYLTPMAGYGYGYEIPTQDGNTIVVQAGEGAELYVGVKDSDNSEVGPAFTGSLLAIMEFFEDAVRAVGVAQLFNAKGQCRLCDATAKEHADFGCYVLGNV